ncbi:MAG: DNRLRE domain-containing protein [Bacteroidia bacterium]
MKNQLLTLASGCLFSVAGFSQTLTLQPDPAAGKDAELFSCIPCGYNNRNFGTKKDLNAIAWTNSGSSSNIRSLLQFNLSSIPANALVTNAVLSLYFNPSSSEGTHSGTNTALLQRVTSSWGELTVTWDTQPTTTAVNQVTLPSSSTATQDYPAINVTAMVQEMVTNPSSNFGFMLRQQTETVFRKMIFASSDYLTAALRPKLVVTYTLPLPVGLLFFTAEKNNNDIALSWSTASENNNKGFEMQRAASTTGAFENAGWLDGYGTSSITHSYWYKDKNIQQGVKYFYRLKQIDFDGNFTYSKIISAEIPVFKNEISIIPNPFTYRADITYNLKENSEVLIEVYNSAGQAISTLLNRQEEKGNHRLSFIPQQFGYSSGNFEIIFFINNEITLKRIIGIK